MEAAAVVATPAAIRSVLATVHDPEIPTVSIVDLGLVHDVQIGPDRIAVELLPTFVACPALEVIRATVVLFGPALCRSLFYCRECRQPFEAFKPI